MIDLTLILAAGVASGTILLFAAVGEIFAERAGVLNLGVEGMMIIGAVTGFIIAVESGRSGVAGLRELLAIIEGAGAGERVAVDLTIARGLDYYTSTIYETFLVGHESYGSVMSGGRYDGLMDMFSGRPTPAVGISLGVDRLLAALTELDLLDARRASADAFFCLFAAADYAHVARVADRLRAHGVGVEVALSAVKLGKQLQQATKKGYRFAILQGADERAQDSVVIKDLAAGTQETLPLADMATWAARLRGQG